MKKQIISLAMGIFMTVCAFAANPPSDFEWKFMTQGQKKHLSIQIKSVNVKEDYIMITQYKGKSTTIDIPKEIEGYKVIVFTDYVHSGVMPTKCIVPETIVWLNCPLFKDGANCEIELTGKTDEWLIMDGECFKYFKKLPYERKIRVQIMADFGNATSVTWSKNWKTNILSRGLITDEYGAGWHKYTPIVKKGLLANTIGGIKNADIAVDPVQVRGYDEPVNKTITEFIFEEGCTEITRNFLSKCYGLKRVVIPKSMKNIAFAYGGFEPTINCAKGNNLEIEFADGVKINFEDPNDKCITENVSIKTRKKLQELGFNFK